MHIVLACIIVCVRVRVQLYVQSMKFQVQVVSLCLHEVPLLIASLVWDLDYKFSVPTLTRSLFLGTLYVKSSSN